MVTPNEVLTINPNDQILMCTKNEIPNISNNYNYFYTDNISPYPNTKSQYTNDPSDPNNNHLPNNIENSSFQLTNTTKKNPFYLRLNLYNTDYHKNKETDFIELDEINNIDLNQNIEKTSVQLSNDIVDNKSTKNNNNIPSNWYMNDDLITDGYASDFDNSNTPNEPNQNCADLTNTP